VSDWIVTGLAAIAVCIVALYALPIRGLRMRRNGLNAEAVFLHLPIVAPMIAIGGYVGPTGAALATLVGFCAAAIIRRTNAVTDLVRHGVLRALVFLAIVPFAPNFANVRELPLLQSSLVFAAALAGISLVFQVALSAPTSALTYHISMRRILERVFRDPRTWIVSGGNVVWATIVRDPVLAGHYYVAVAMWLPVIVTSLLLRTIDKQHAELHRL
jgi:hypothetical protein